MNRRNTLALTCIFATITLLGLTWGLAQTPPGAGGFGDGYGSSGYGGEGFGGYGAPAGGDMMGPMPSMGYGMGGQIYDPYAHHELAAQLQPVLQRLRDAADDEQKKAIKDELAKILADYFDRDLKWRASEIDSIEQRVKRLRTQLEQRQEAKDDILQLQLKVLENEAAGLGFFGQRPANADMAGGAMMGMEGGAGYGDMDAYPMHATFGNPLHLVPSPFKKRTAVDFTETPLGEVLDFFRDVTDANIYVDQQAMKKAKIALDTPVSLSLQDVSVATLLDLITYELSVSLGVRYDDGIAMIGTRSWPALTERFRLGNDGSVASQQTEKRLVDTTATYEFIETPLSEVLDYVSDATGANIILHHRSLIERNIRADTPVTLSLKDVKPRTALRLILDSVGKSLFFSVVDGVVVVSAKSTNPYE
ncbi:MAG: hypothetical protein KJ000_18225 [Pirellulaceae bacterium]|nr:hypothetical protein [Pirellulaceae bacterium]